MSRVISVAAALDTRFLNPSVVALNRLNRAKSQRARNFWRSVIHALYRPFSCQSWTNDDIRNWNDIRAQQARRA